MRLVDALMRIRLTHLRKVLVLLAALPSMLAAQQPGLSDPASEAKLRAVFPAVDSIMREFTGREHVPGAAWAIVVGDRVAHTGVTGLRDVAAKAPVDTGSVFRIASMTKSFTAMAIMRLRDEGKLSLDDPAERYVPELKALKYPTSDSPKITIRHLLSHSHRLSGGQSLGRPAARAHRRRAERHDPEGYSLLQPSRRGVRVLELRLRHPGAHRHPGVGQAVQRLRRHPHPAAARHALDDAVAGRRAGRAPGARVPVGGRAVEGRAAAPRRLVRRDGRHAHVACATSAGTSRPSSAPGRRAMGRRPGRCAGRRCARCSRSGGRTRRAWCGTRRACG